MFSVQDTGKGIIDEEMSRLFNRFVQANAKTHIQVSGTHASMPSSAKLLSMADRALDCLSRVK